MSSMRIMMVGDIHGNTLWLENVILPAAEMLQADVIAQVGDLGYDTVRNPSFLAAAQAAPIPFYFIDGNHENHLELAHDTAVARAAHNLTAHDPVPLGGSLIYLPRGSRVTWDGVRVAALGGARSIDRGDRAPGTSWFLEEIVNDNDLALLAAGGPCDVLLTHDIPASAPLPLGTYSEVSSVWQLELAACAEHRRRIDEAVDLVRPSLLIHGHYHRRWDGWAQRPWGRVQVCSLAEDGSDIPGNVALLRCEDGSATVHYVWVEPDS
jgi:Icc-related predicted phosphoesterase